MALTNVFPETNDTSMIAALGPFKLELRVVTVGAANETFESKLANPQAAGIMIASDLAAGGAEGFSVSVSGKTVSIHDVTSGDSFMVLVVGF